MAQTLIIDNYAQLNLLETTQLDADSVAAATALTVKNNQDYAASDKVIIGAPGTENNELAIVSSLVGNTTLNVSATKFAHKRFDQITKVFGNQIKIYSAPNVNGIAPLDAAFSTLVATVNIDVDNQFTAYTDVTGSNAIWYKYTYYNSVSTSETDISNSLAVRGGNVGNYCSVEDIRDEAGFNGNTYITDVMIDLRRRDAQGEVNATLGGLYTVPFTEPINPLIAKITRLLAAGFLLTKGFGPVVALNTDNGKSKLDEARQLLTDLNNKTKTLVDTTGADISIQNADAGIFSAYPNSNTATDDIDSGGGGRMFRVGDIAGNGGRY